MPAHTPPHKPGRILSSDEARLDMCRIAFASLPRAEVCDYEIVSGGMSYTYLTCRHFREKYPSAELFWLVGTDMLRDFPTWKNPEEIVRLVTLAVCGRNDEETWWLQEEEKFYRRFGKNFVRLPYNGLDVSSTKIRVLAGAGMRLSDYVAAETEEYIQKNGLYKIPFADRALALEKPDRRAHSIRVACMAAGRALALKVPERKAITAALLHDCAKNLPEDSPYLEGFVLPKEWGEVPPSVRHQFAGAYVAERWFGVTDEEVLDAIRYHTSGRENMTTLEKLIFLSDMLEEGRSYAGVEELRTLFYGERDLDACLERALEESLKFLKEKNAEAYPLTERAYAFIKEYNQSKGVQNGTGKQ